MIWSKNETLSRAAMSAWQLAKLKDEVSYAYDNIDFYRQRMDKAGIRPAHIRTLKDLAALPMVVKTDLRDQYPFGLFAVPLRKIVRFHSSSGKTV